LVVPLGGNTKVEGLELALTALPVEGLTLGMSLGYQDVEFSEYSDIIFKSTQGHLYPNSDFLPILVPEWNGNLSATYESDPLFDDAYLSFSIMGIWQDKMRNDANPGRIASRPETQAFAFAEETWMVNARIALREIKAGDFTGEIALWGRNLMDEDGATGMLNLGSLALTATYTEERYYGIDLTLRY